MTLLNELRVIQENIDIKLYHYNTKCFKELKTLELQGISDESINNKSTFWKHPDKYTKHISFFFDRPPFEFIIKHYKNHDFYKPGMALCEHVINVNDLNDDVKYYVTESSIDQFLLDNLWSNNELYKEYIFRNLRYYAKTFLSEQGSGLDNLINAIKKYKGRTKEYFEKATKRHDFEEMKRLYAANVPHIFLYPSKGIIQVSEHNKITL